MTFRLVPKSATMNDLERFGLEEAVLVLGFGLGLGLVTAGLDYNTGCFQLLLLPQHRFCSAYMCMYVYVNSY